ncbi:MAG TPA: GNAT family N-acetyltransferase [Steroidobacteraceae bacterium]|jgi:predicted GNAT family N-acyltransferase|nr:GNAT family N-acetyltransferase [Steroidobacteraceae bacterium]
MAAAQVECSLADWRTDRRAIESVRRRVFVEEQEIPEMDEFDAEDACSVHVLARLNRDPVGTGRLNPAGKIGRIAVIAGLRGRGIGSQVLGKLLEEARRLGIREPFLHAQMQAVTFYGKFGFSREGEVFDEAGIPHMRMSLVLE